MNSDEWMLIELIRKGDFMTLLVLGLNGLESGWQLDLLLTEYTY